MISAAIFWGVECEGACLFGASLTGDFTAATCTGAGAGAAAGCADAGAAEDGTPYRP
jgi:hypothetical protein